MSVGNINRLYLTGWFMAHNSLVARFLVHPITLSLHDITHRHFGSVHTRRFLMCYYNVNGSHSIKKCALENYSCELDLTLSQKKKPELNKWGYLYCTQELYARTDFTELCHEMQHSPLMLGKPVSWHSLGEILELHTILWHQHRYLPKTLGK